MALLGDDNSDMVNNVYILLDFLYSAETGNLFTKNFFYSTVAFPSKNISKIFKIFSFSPRNLKK